MSAAGLQPRASKGTWGSLVPDKLLKIWIITMRAAIVALVVIWILNIPGRLQIPIFTEQLLSAVLGLALALCFLTFPFASKKTGEEAIVATVIGHEQSRIGAIDIVLSLLSLGCCFYVAVRYPDLIIELATRPVGGVIVAGIIVLLVFEASRRVTGLALAVIVLLLCAHALLGWMLPEQFASRPIAISRLLVYLAIDTNALLGSTLQIAVVVVIPFIILGQVLSRCGGSDFFADLAASLMGHFRGGAAKIAVVGSAFFGMISGSAVANVASVGTITIPLMKRAGFKATTAAGIEAVGSTGGQICPPVMGAAAFLMAEYLQVPYGRVMVAAIIPAVLFYAALFIQVDLESAKLGILGQPRKTLPSVWTVLRNGWHFVIPFAVLVGGLLWVHMEAEYAALLATLVLVVLVMTVKHKGRRMRLGEVVSAVVSSGGAVIDIIIITAIAGILIGALAITGVSFSLTQQLLTASGDSLAILLILTALVSFVLGLPLPTVGVYVILATLAAPVLVQAGLTPMQAHMFVLFNGILGMVTPPVALAAFAAATIGQADQWRTGWTAMRLSWCAYFIPFMFAYSAPLLLDGSWTAILAALADALLGIFMGTLAVVGYFMRRISVPLRVLYAALAALVLVPASAFGDADLVGIAAAAAALAAIGYEVVRGRMASRAAAPS
jgi:TRAP transporter 4TM/12TM fusion protein